MENNLILVTDWERVESDDFYISDDWAKEVGKEVIEEAQRLQKEGHLYYGYVVDAKNYAIYTQMDADKVLINRDGDVEVWCESHVIGNNHAERMEYEL